MIKIKILLFFAASIIFLFCTPAEISISSSQTGSNLDPEGNISNSSLIYTFHITGQFKTNKDFFNFIYFEGDTVCFQIEFNKDVKLKSTSIIYTINKVSFTAERIDIYDDSITGFSLLGSILEKGYKNTLNKAFKLEQFNNLKIPITITAKLKTNKKNISHTINCTAIIKLKK